MTEKLVIVSFIFLLQIACKKKNECFQPEVDLRFDIYPAKNYFSVGDSIWVIIDMEVVTTDIDDGRPVNTSIFNLFDVNVRLINLQPSNSPESSYIAWPHFKSTVQSGAFVKKQSEFIHSFKFEKVENKFMVKLLIVPQQKGAFVINISDGGGKNGSCNLLFAYTMPLFIHNNHELKEKITGAVANEYESVYPYFFEVK